MLQSACHDCKDFLLFPVFTASIGNMPSGFVSGGTIERPLDRDDEWLKAQLELEATRKRKDEESRHDGGKSLYEVLQQNKGDFIALLGFEKALIMRTNMSGSSRLRQLPSKMHLKSQYD